MDAHPTSHPTDKTLSSYGLGKLDDRSAKAVNNHLEQCSECRQRVAELSADSFLERVRDGQNPAKDPASQRSRPGAPPAKPAKTPGPPPAGTLPPGLAEHPDYEIKRELGRGGIGVVYLAHNTLMERDEVLKVMGPQVIDRPGVVDRFLREIRAVAKLRHPNIVTAYHAFRLSDSIVFAMEYVVGYDLAQLVKGQGALPVAPSCNFAYHAALALQHAHEERLVHRDIKPSNLMTSRKGNKAIVKILDFGLAKASREQKLDSALTSDGQTLGTPDYIAPEQIIDAQSADIRADIYSLGGTLYHLLTGRPPFQRKSVYDTYQAHISQDADPLNFVRPEVPAELAALVAKMMAKEPGRRFQDPGEVAQALMPFFKKRATAFDRRELEISQAGPPQARRTSTGTALRPERPAPEAAKAAQSEARKPVPRAPSSILEGLIEIDGPESWSGQSESRPWNSNLGPARLVTHHRPGRCVVVGVSAAVLLRLAVDLSSLLPFGGREVTALEAHLPKLGMVLAIVGIVAGWLLGGRGLPWRDQFACGFTGGFFGLGLSAVIYAINKTLAPALGPWSPSLIAVIMLWAVLGAVMGIAFAALISRKLAAPEVTE